jgi:hypothetical protein
MAQNVERVWKFVCADRRLILQMTTEKLNVDKEIVGKILAENLGMKVSAEMMPQILSDYQQ